MKEDEVLKAWLTIVKKALYGKWFESIVVMIIQVCFAILSLVCLYLLAYIYWITILRYP